MINLTLENSREFEHLNQVLSDSIDKEIICELDHYLGIVREKSRALASSLKRCFDNARKSQRYVLVYNLGKEDALANKDVIEKDMKSYFENYLKEYFEKNEFMHYREFVRLNRACSIDLGGNISAPIKGMYNNFFFGKRLVKAYELGRNQSKTENL